MMEIPKLINGLEKSITSSRTKVIVKGATATSALCKKKKKHKRDALEFSSSLFSYFSLHCEYSFVILKDVRVGKNLRSPNPPTLYKIFMVNGWSAQYLTGEIIPFFDSSNCSGRLPHLMEGAVIYLLFFACPAAMPSSSGRTTAPRSVLLVQMGLITLVMRWGISPRFGHRCTLLPWPEWFIQGWHRTQVSLMSMSPES